MYVVCNRFAIFWVVVDLIHFFEETISKAASSQVHFKHHLIYHLILVMQPRPTTFRTVTIALVQILFLSVPKHVWYIYDKLKNVWLQICEICGIFRDKSGKLGKLIQSSLPSFQDTSAALLQAWKRKKKNQTPQWSKWSKELEPCRTLMSVSFLPSCEPFVKWAQLGPSSLCHNTHAFPEHV